MYVNSSIWLYSSTYSCTRILFDLSMKYIYNYIFIFLYFYSFMQYNTCVLYCMINTLLFIVNVVGFL